MRGRVHIVIKSNKLHYELELNRNITIIQGDSGIGKTTLVKAIRSKGNRSYGVQIECTPNYSCETLSNKLNTALFEIQQMMLDDKNKSGVVGRVIFLDEDARYLTSKEFADAVYSSGYYFVLVTRYSLKELSYSIKEIYTLHSSNYYQSMTPVYTSLQRLFTELYMERVKKPSVLFIEDSKAGFEMYQAVCSENSIEPVTMEGKSNLKQTLARRDELKIKGDILVIVDGAAFGSEVRQTLELMENDRTISLWAPESFEYLILCSGIVYDKNLKDKLENTSNYVESKEFASWEQYFTKLLIDITEHTRYPYNKRQLNSFYKTKGNLNKFEKLLPFNTDIDLDRNVSEGTTENAKEDILDNMSTVQ